jgi:hypothetical protein
VSTKRLTIGITVAAVAALASAGPATAAPDRTINVTKANTSSSPVTWDGTSHDGLNQGYDADTGVPCGKDTDTYCDDSLVNLTLPAGFQGQVQIDIDNYRPDPTADFDLYVYESDAAGHAIRRVTNGGSFGRVLVGNGLPNGLPETYSFGAKPGYYLVRVVYYQVLVPGQYSGAIQLNDLIARAPTPPDVDSPPGLQDHLASNPALGFKSHSEPHIAQSPIDPDILVAGSKQYYRDRDSLKEYEFKIGTYVSFDRGVTWTDLGQVDVCPPAQAPQSSYPDKNTCYPDEDPNKGGTGSEDVKDPNDPNDTQFDDRGSGDLAEEYTTSDIWTQFDDEGNAYVMVLDHPPFPLEADPAGLGTEEDGWGMTMHKWDSVSVDDLKTGKTWGPRVPINFYADEIRERAFLDDKNTMAVNNAGPDRDGKPGTILTCWGRTLIPAKQSIVCERSTDGGKSFPGEPIPVSEPQNLVIGVHVFPDPTDENTFYLMWNHYVLTTSPVNTLYFAKTIDGGLTWTPAIPVGPPFTPIPSNYPGQRFRNLSIPIGAAAPNADLYAVYAQYNAAHDTSTDADDMQADIVFVKSTDGGISWSSPKVVNQDNTDADQFQPYVAITPQGEVNVNYFDRRNDKRVTSGGQVTHDGNFYVDEYLSRSTDGGATWKDTRLSHDMSDPEYNTPIDSAGNAFFGDYQGMVADDCFTIPFMQDAHLGLPASRDDDFDNGVPRSDYQETFAWRVPNTKQGPGCAVQTPPEPVNEEGLPNVTLTAPRLASDVSTDNHFKLRINASAANIAYYQLQYKRPGSKGFRNLSRKLLTASYDFRGAFSATYIFRARAISLTKKAGDWSTEKVSVVPHDDKRASGRPRYTGSWSRPKVANSYVGQVSRSSKKGSRMRMNVRGSRVYLIGRRSNAGGKALVIVNGIRRGTINFYSAKTQSRRVLFSSALSPSRQNRIEILHLGQEGSSKSKGTAVEIDAIGYRTR